MSAEILKLVEYLTEAEIVALAENFGGTRLYVPAKADLNHCLVQAIGVDGYKRLADAISPDTIRVPLCREIRAVHYRKKGLSNGKIASRLGITEPAVNKMFKRLQDRGDAPPTQRP